MCVCAGMRGRFCVIKSVKQLNASLALDSGGASDSVMVHLLSVTEGVCMGGAEVIMGGRADKMNSFMKSGQNLNICISTESEPAKKEPSIEGKLV